MQKSAVIQITTNSAQVINTFLTGAEAAKRADQLGAGHFAVLTEQDLTEMANKGTLSGVDLVRLYNSMADNPVGKFTDKPTGVKRCWAALQVFEKPAAAKKKSHGQQLYRRGPSCTIEMANLPKQAKIVADCLPLEGTISLDALLQTIKEKIVTKQPIKRIFGYYKALLITRKVMEEE